MVYVATDRTIRSVNGSPEKVPFSVENQSALTKSPAPTTIAAQTPIRFAVIDRIRQVAEPTSGS
jgi:hypothetical protein